MQEKAYSSKYHPVTEEEKPKRMRERNSSQNQEALWSRLPSQDPQLGATVEKRDSMQERGKGNQALFQGSSPDPSYYSGLKG